MKKVLPVLCVLMAVLTIVIAMTTVSFSWFEPDIKKGMGLEFSEEAPIRAQTCSIKTYEGQMGNKIVNYSVNEVSSGNVTVSAQTSGDKTTPGYAYYKTVITNTSEEYDTVVSLFLSSFAPASTDTKAGLGVAYPTNSFRTFSAKQTDIHIVRNAHVPKLVRSDANPGQLSIEWFVRCDKGSVTFDPASVYLVYN